MIPLLVIPVLMTAQDVKPPLCIAEEQGIRAELLEVEDLFQKAYSLKVRFSGERARDYKTVTVRISVELGNDHWHDLPPFNLDPREKSFRWTQKTKKEEIEGFTGKAKMQILATEFSAAALERMQETEEESRRLAEIKKQPKNVRALLEAHRIRVGLTDLQVLLAWGKPTSVNTTVTKQGSSQQWVYATGDYVYISGGKVTAFQTSR